MDTWGRRIVVGVLVIIAAALGVTYILKLRADSHRESVRDSLRQLGQYALTTKTDAKTPANARTLIPPATMPSTLPVDQRLSWVVDAMTTLDQRRQNYEQLLTQLNPTLPWNAESHQRVNRIPLRILLCPANPPSFNNTQPAVTQLVGITGMGDNAGSLPLNSPNAGALRYDGGTPISSFTDGLSQTLMFAETNRELGPWLQGGPATARGADERSATAFGTRFGGVHVSGAFFAYADGRATFLGEKIDRTIFRMLTTRAGGVGALTELVE
jgi:hypothetical protein